MTEEQRKEAISKQFLRILAHMHGYKILEPGPDHGVDMIVCPVTERVDPLTGKRRFLDSQFKLDFQIKSTTLAGVIDDDDKFKFDLESKTYNDLVQRRVEVLPLHLLVVVLNDAPPTCVSVDLDKISVIGSAFWYLPEVTDAPTPNAATKRISIPKANKAGVGFIGECYDRLEIVL